MLVKHQCMLSQKGEVSLINKVNEIIEKVIELDLYKKWDMEATKLQLNLAYFKGEETCLLKI